MLEGLLDALLTLLAFAGGAALFVRLARAAARLVLSVAEVTSAAGLAEVSARRGDLTALAERREIERRARRMRRRDGLHALLWLLWLVVPLLVGWVPAAFALAAPLWLLPSAPVRPPQPKSEG